MTLTEADCRLMIAGAAIEYVSENQSPFEYDDMAYWLDEHGRLCLMLYAPLVCLKEIASCTKSTSKCGSISCP